MGFSGVFTGSHQQSEKFCAHGIEKVLFGQKYIYREISLNWQPKKHRLYAKTFLRGFCDGSTLK